MMIVSSLMWVRAEGLRVEGFCVREVPVTLPYVVGVTDIKSWGLDAGSSGGVGPGRGGRAQVQARLRRFAATHIFWDF